MATRPGHADVQNTARDTIHFAPVTNPKDEDGGKPFVLRLGSVDDKDVADDGVLSPRQVVPTWALDQLRENSTTFKALEASGKIRVTRQA